ncbi:MAG: isoprenylcysteine carboxylmethyltransferase family protein [Bacteroidota bacterium]
MQTELNLLIVGLSWGLYYFLHSFLASTRCKAWGRSRIGQRKYRLLYNLWSGLGLIGLLWGLARLGHLALWPDFLVVQILGLMSLAAGLTLGYRAIKAYDLGEFSGLGQSTEEDTPLVIDGLNAYIRHPLYSAIMLIAFGIGFLWPWDTLWVTIGLTVIYVFWGSELEEKKLIKRYGTAYLEYRKSVSRFVPKLL